MIEKDKIVLRQLARRIRKHAESPENKCLVSDWTALNDLQGARPMVLVSPERSWLEIKADWVWECEGELARSLEDQMRMKLHLSDVIKDDSTFDPDITVSPVFDDDGFGVDIGQHHSGSSEGAYAIDFPLKNLDDDLEKLSFRQLTVDREASERRLYEVREALGDILEVQSGSIMDWTNGLTWDAIKLIGLENLMLAMYDNPEGLHRLMAFMRDERMNWLDQKEASGYLALNTGSSLIGSGNLGHSSQLPDRLSPPEGGVRLCHTWGLSESQETVGISPDMFGEFIFPYQKPLIERFGLSYYGCCEPVEERFDHIGQIKNLRCLSISPWSNLEKAARVLGKNYVYCRKPNPSPVCTDNDERVMREDIRRTLEAAGDLNLMMIMKDVHTLQHEPDRLVRWVQLAREEIDRYSGL